MQGPARIILGSVRLQLWARVGGGGAGQLVLLLPLLRLLPQCPRPMPRLRLPRLQLPLRRPPPLGLPSAGARCCCPAICPAPSGTLAPPPGLSLAGWRHCRSAINPAPGGINFRAALAPLGAKHWGSIGGLYERGRVLGRAFLVAA